MTADVTIATIVRVTVVAISLMDRALRRAMFPKRGSPQLPSCAERTIHLARIGI